MKRLLFALSIVAIVAPLWQDATPASACLCVPLSAVEYAQTADVILVGDVISFSWMDTTTEGQPGGGHIRYLTLKADRHLKGSGSSEVTASWEWCDRFTGSVGDRYVAFLHSKDEEFTDSPCFGSSPIDAPWPGVNVAEVEAITGPGEPPDDSLDEPRPPDANSFPYFAAAIAAVLGPLAFLAGAAFVWRRRGS